MNKQMHLHEDTSKPENRVNLALFHLLMIDEFAAFVKSKLKIPAECCIYPAPNLETEEFDTCERPDFKIELDGVLMGYIEVELGNEDQAQLTGYREKIKEPVY